MPTLARTYTVVAPDFRGYGQSDKPETGYEVRTMVEDLRQLLDQLGIKSANVVGHDLGGIVAYVYAAEHRDQVSRLGIIEAPIIGVPSPTMLSRCGRLAEIIRWAWGLSNSFNTWRRQSRVVSSKTADTG
jgi:pimeloyl-ACP methyl ester carboxylesterase